MNRKFYLFAGLALVAVAANGQRLKADYIQWPSSSGLPDYVQEWVPGTPLFEDENFFVSRVKPKTFIERNTATQVYESITDANDKKLVFWVPVGNTNLNGVHTDALPTGMFDSEVFSAWSYVTHYGDWTSPYGWIPGGFADVAHKHGVAVDGQASIPNAPLTDAWQTCIRKMGTVDVDKLAKFLYYHGVDGISYNSEFSTSRSIITSLNNTHAALVKKMLPVNPIFENIWYSGTGDSGSCTWTDYLRDDLKGVFGDKDNVRTSIFLNYNWNSDSYINGSLNNANSLGRDIRDCYAGMNMQGGTKGPDEWIRHKTCNYSIGLWGAHDFNYIWTTRARNGSANANKQKTYQTHLEYWFTNGKRNPIAKMNILSTRNLSPTKDWHGMSPFMSERSTLGWNLDDEPFISYFNLGNGCYFNWMGQRQNDCEWYNIGIQDYMPTWRFWFADQFLGKDPSNIPANGLEAEFAWDEAYMGGSSLRIYGTVGDEYLHLFKTNFQLANNDVITVRYKLLKGAADVNLALSTVGSETTIRNESRFTVLEAAKADVDEDNWVTKEFKLSGAALTPFRSVPVAMIALHFKNANDLDFRLGEFSIRRGKTPTPAEPQITIAKALSNNYAGVDAKVIFNMANNKAAGEPVYNLDVNTSMFRLWAQEENCEPVNMGATTSWAGIMYAIPATPTAKKMRFGVQAVAVDMNSASEITWSNYIDLPQYAIVNDIDINKTTIKPGEDFEIAFVDPNHAAADWKIYDVSNNVVFTGNGTSIKTNLPDVGAYHVEVDGTRYDYFMMVTAWSTGALPEITSLTFNGDAIGDNDEISVVTNEEFTLGYTGRECNGSSSQGVSINEHYVGFPVKDAQIGVYDDFAVGCWVKFTNFAGEPEYSRIFGVDDRRIAWPQNNWGWVWTELKDTGEFTVTFRTNIGKELQYRYNEANWMPLNAWTHIAFSFEHKDSQFRMRTFINGVEVLPKAICHSKDDSWLADTDDPDKFWVNTRYSLDQNNWFYFAGTGGNVCEQNNGVIDDFVLWDGPITLDDVKKAYQGLDENNLPDNVKCFWSFENKAGDDYQFRSKGSLVGAPASVFELGRIEGVEGGGHQIPTEPVYSSGCPLIPGNAFAVETTPSWKVQRSVLAESNGSDVAGQTKVTMTRKGQFTAKLTLSNVLGSDTREYPVIDCGDEAALDAVEGGEISAYTVDDAIVVNFPEEGVYTINVYNVAGQLVGARTVDIHAGGFAAVGVKNAGVYLLGITRDGRTVCQAKLIKK